MKVIRVRNVHQALPEALFQLNNEGVRRESRNGPVIMFPEPVTTVYENPAERVLFWGKRDCNPFFHLFESLWMLAGRNDVAYVAQYVKRMASFSDDGKTFHGAYGYRWRHHFEFDQLFKIVAALRLNPDDRRQVLSMWDASVDLGKEGRDFPCNLQAVFQIAVDGRLDMMVTNRSNDIIWGAYGANAVHFSYLHEYMSRLVGVPQGIYRQVSANFHAYQSVYDKVADLQHCAADPNLPEALRWAGFDPYTDGVCEPFPLIGDDIGVWHEDLEQFLDDPRAIGFRDPFFRRVALPMWHTHNAYSQKGNPNRFYDALEQLERIEATDWRLAAREWIERRAFEAEQKNQNTENGS